MQHIDILQSFLCLSNQYGTLILLLSNNLVHTLMASSHCEHRQDKTVLSCRCSQCELSSWQSQTVFNVFETEQFCPVLSVVWTHLRTSLDPLSKYDITIGYHVACELETGSGQDKTQFTPHFETGQNHFEILSRRQSWLVAKSVHTTNTNKTRQDCLVLMMFAVWTSHKLPLSPCSVIWYQCKNHDG